MPLREEKTVIRKNKMPSNKNGSIPRSVLPKEVIFKATVKVKITVW